MINKVKSFLNKNFVKNVMVLVTGTAAAQVVAMALSPIITRLYGPEAFGVMGTFNAIVTIVAPIAALTYPIAIVLPKRDQDAKGLIKVSLLISLLISLITVFLIILFGEKILRVFNVEEISFFIYLIPLVIIFSGFMQVAEQWLIRTKQFTINAKVTFYQSLIVNGGKVGVGLLYPYATVLVLFTAIGSGLKAFMLILFSRKSNRNKVRSEDGKPKKLKDLAKKYYDFPLYRAPQVFLDALTQGLPILMLTTFFGPASAGFYSIGRTVLSMPSNLIGKAVGDVFYPRIAEAYNNQENMTDLIRKATLVLLGIGALPFGLVILFGPYLFSFVFGPEWETAGEYARWIAFFSYAGFTNRPSVRSLPVLNAQRFQLFYTISWLIVRLVLLAIGYYVFENDIIAIALFGMSGVISNFVLIMVTLRLSKKRQMIQH